jgi:hypothetical protein
MTMASTMTPLLVSLVSLAALWFFLNWPYRDYEVDRFRQDVFNLRDEMFDEAAGGLISFDDPAYGLLRMTMNGFIRFAHRLSFLNLFIFSAVAPHENFGSFSAEWKKRTGHLEPTVKARLESYRSRMNRLTAQFLILGSPLVLVTLLPPAFCFVMVHHYWSAVKKLIARPIDNMDSAALAEGCL